MDAIWIALWWLRAPVDYFSLGLASLKEAMASHHPWEAVVLAEQAQNDSENASR
jgi:hypothetical protein